MVKLMQNISQLDKTSLAQLVGAMHKICKVRGSNLGHHKKDKVKSEIDCSHFTFSCKLHERIHIVRGMRLDE